MPLLRPQTLFGRTLATIAVVSAVFLFFTLAVVSKFLLMPVGHRSAADLVALMSSAGETWAALPPALRHDYARTIAQRNGLRIQPHQPDLPERGLTLPYFYFVEDLVSAREGRSVTLRSAADEDGTPRYFAPISTPHGIADVGVSRYHVGVQPPLALFLVFSMGMLATMATAVALVRRLTAPLERLSSAARRLGSGDWPEPLPESGPEELATLTRRFNRMAVQLEELLANRTTLLAGISHDLRTPLARMQVALEMLPADREPELLDGLRADLKQMNTLIGQFMEVARGLEDSNTCEIELEDMLEGIAAAARRGGASVEVRRGPPCRLELPELALRRIVENLVDNAARYGHGSVIELEWHCSADSAAIHVLDRGPGIPEDKVEAVFRPFYRLERSRNRGTGGSGLGLAIARQLAESNGWQIRLLSRHGGGTRAVLNLAHAGRHKKVRDTR